jgi:hypothetical protein
MMGNEQFWASGNVGIDFSFGSDIELTVGGYGGLVWFGFPTQESSNNGLMFNSDEEELLSMAGVNLNDLTSQYQEFVSVEEKIANSVFGLVGRARLSLEYHIIPLISVGVQGTAGYHFVLSGEQAASSAKGTAIEKVLADQIDDTDLRKEIEPIVKNAAGLGSDDEVNLEDLKGVNYSAGLFLNIKF